MFTTSSLARHPAFEAYAEGVKVQETALAAVADYWRTAAEFSWWWTEKWLQAPAVFAAWATPRVAAAQAMARPTAAVIDLAEAAAARSVFATVEVIETVVQAPVVIAEEAVAVAEALVEAVAEVIVETVTPDPDDLTLLVGIGPKLSLALAERGVTRYAHIAAWTEQDLAEVDKALDLKGRAVRDAWVVQAKRLSGEG